MPAASVATTSNLPRGDVSPGSSKMLHILPGLLESPPHPLAKPTGKCTDDLGRERTPFPSCTPSCCRGCPDFGQHCCFTAEQQQWEAEEMDSGSQPWVISLQGTSGNQQPGQLLLPSSGYRPAMLTSTLQGTGQGIPWGKTWWWKVEEPQGQRGLSQVSV